MQFNKLASQIAKLEGLKDEESIGNVRENLRITLTLLAKMPAAELGELLFKYSNRK